MAIVWIPALMRDLTGGQAQVRVHGRTVGQLLDALDAAYPGFKERVCEGDRINPMLIVTVDDHVGKLGLLEPVDEESEVHFMPAMGGS